jgi:hypothetical protein
VPFAPKQDFEHLPKGRLVIDDEKTDWPRRDGVHVGLQASVASALRGADSTLPCGLELSFAMSRWSPLLTVLALLSSVPACSSSNDANGPTDSNRGDSPPATTHSGVVVAFSQESLVLDPGESRDLAVTVMPAGSYDVRLALTGDAGDAFVDRSVVSTADDGTAHFTLTAPSLSSTFAVRATAGVATASLPVSSGLGFTTLAVIPLYTGERRVDAWIATVSTDGSCGNTPGVPPTDGFRVSEPSAFPRITDVPVGTPLRVTLRAGHFAGGCTDVRGLLLPVESHVAVEVTDRPLQLGGVHLDVAFGFDGDNGWTTAWAPVLDKMMDRFAPGGTDAKSLLDAMQTAATGNKNGAAFASSRQTNEWDTRIAPATDGLLGIGGLSSRLRRWLDAGVGTSASTNLRGTLSAENTANGKAKLSFGTVGSATATKASFPSSIDVTWSSTVDDRVLFGGKLEFAPSALAAALTEEPATAEEKAATTVPAALAAVACHDVATSLVASSSTTGVAYSGCDADCAESLCEVALSTMWNRVVDTKETRATLELTANGQVTSVSDGASPEAFDGSWVGTTLLGGRTARVSGAATGSKPTKAIP